MGEAIDIMVNGASHRVPSGTTVSGLIHDLALVGPVAVERNREVVPRARHGDVVLASGDRLEIVGFVGGG